jgi:hypothetical protein
MIVPNRVKEQFGKAMKPRVVAVSGCALLLGALAGVVAEAVNPSQRATSLISARRLFLLGRATLRIGRPPLLSKVCSRWIKTRDRARLGLETV